MSNCQNSKLEKKMNVPWAKPYVGKEEFEAVKACFEQGWLSMGKGVVKLESLMSKLCESTYTVAVNSGTAALDMALKLINIEPGDEVIIPGLSYIATGNSVLYQKAIPVFADIEPNTYVISADEVAKKITSKTKAVIAIDYAGHSADYDALCQVVKGKNIFLIEDAAPGLGGKYKGKALCSRADIGITSFHMAKIFTSVEGGMLFTESKEYDGIARMMRSQGEDPAMKYHHPVLGHNYRMSDLYAAVGLEQLKRFDFVLAKRSKIADNYTQALEKIEGIKVPEVNSDCQHAWFLYPVLVDDRDRVVADLKDQGIGVNVSWPMPIYEQKMYQEYYKEPCTVSKELTQKVICLPIYYEMIDEEQNYVIEKLIQVVKGKGESE